MTALSDFRVDEQLRDGGTSIVYRASRLTDEQSVIIKILNREYPTPQEVASFQKEYEICKKLSTEGVQGVASPLSFLNDGKDVAMVLDFLPGMTLSSYLSLHPLSVEESLRIAIALAQTMGDIHKAGIIHKDIKPSNIIVNPETGEIWVIDFGCSILLNVEEVSPRSFEGTLAYMSPEQTGRMNRLVDYRTDFYSLGVTLYQMLCGQLPFSATDPLELVHAHIALEPKAVHRVNPDIPLPVSALVHRLLAKTAESRYQSTDGLLADLNTLYKHFKAGELSENFALGQSDISDTFQISGRLYGRDQEILQLMTTFEKASQGSSEMLFVSGYSGIGKSALIHEVHKPIVQSRGYFMAGKFDQFKRNIPYASIIEAFSNLIAQLLAEPEDQLSYWRTLILKALGSIAGVAVDVLPEFALIIGEQDKVPELSGEAAQNRLNRTFLELIKVFAQPTHPLVLFLDDLQWADRPTLNLLRILVTEKDLGHLMVIGCYRDNEVDDNHPLMLTLQKITEQRAKDEMSAISNLHIEGLSLESLCALVVDCLHYTEKAAQPLATLLHQKTLGNPFFVNQFLRVLHRDGLLYFEEGRWCFQLEEIQSRGMTDNVIMLMTSTLVELGTSTQKMLQLAAALGNVFELKTLAACAEKTTQQTSKDLWEALVEGYLFPLDSSYRLLDIQSHDTKGNQQSQPETEVLDLNPRFRFLHDRVQQAAYSLIPEAERAQTHLHIGRVWLKLLEGEALEERLFMVVDQFVKGLAEVTERDEQLVLAGLFAQAGNKARLASAHEPAIKYFTAAQELLGEDLWTTHYDLGQRVVFQRSESEYLSANFDTAEELFDELVTNSRTDLEKAKVYRLKLSLYQSRGLFLETVDIAYKGLAHLGVNLPPNPSQLTFLRELVKFKFKMRGKTEEDLKQLPTCTDPIVVTAIDIMNDFSGPAFFVDINMYLVLVLKMCSLSLQHGNAAESAYCWTLYGMMNGPIMGNVPHGMELGRVGEFIDQRHSKPTLIPKVALSLGGLVYQWGQHPRLSLPYFERGFQAALESGDPTHAGYCANFMVCMFSVIGEPLTHIEETTSRFLNFAKKNQIEVQSEIQVVERQMARALMGKTQNTLSWSDESGFDEAAWLQKARTFQSRQPLHNYLIEKQATLYLLGEYEAALACGDESATMLDVSLGIPISSNHHLYYGLVNAKFFHKKGRVARKNLKLMIKQHRKWARHNPDGFLHKQLLLEAEWAHCIGQDSKAESLYDQAIHQAEAQGFLHHTAITNELAGRHYLERSRNRIGMLYLRTARHDYQRWGAQAIVTRMEEEFPDLAFAKLLGNSQRLEETWSHSSSSQVDESLDLHTLLQASRAISSEIVMDKLLKKLLTLALENAGARRAILILENKGHRSIEAEQVAGEESARILHSQPLKDRVDLAHGVINFVARTREAVVLDDAREASGFNKDPYIAAQRTRSLLCSPILHGGNLAGFLYLENELLAGAFTPERLELLRLLSSQTAISIENALLYENLEEKVRERTQQLQERFQELQKTQAQLIQSEKMASLGTLVSGVAHELNNPANFTFTGANNLQEHLLEFDRLLQGLLEEDPDTELQGMLQERFAIFYQNLEAIAEGADRIQSIVSDLKSFSRLDETEYKEASVIEGLRSTLTLVQASYRKQITFETDFKADPIVPCWPAELNQAFMNIMLNACQAMTTKESTQKQTTNTLHIRSWIEDDAWLNISFVDHGYGMSEDIQKRIFEPFFTTREVGEGAGLGLSEAFGTLQKHQGTIKVHSAPDKGTTVTLSLPLVRNK